MRNMSRRSGIWKRLLSTILIGLWAILAVNSALAEIDVSRIAKLELRYAVEGEPVSGVSFALYRVADVDRNCYFTLTDGFSDCPVEVNGLDSEGWRTLAETLAGFVANAGITPEETRETNAAGMINFGARPTGLYLLVGEAHQAGNELYIPGATLVSLPNRDGKGAWEYDVTVLPKTEIRTVDTVSLEVQKIWDDADAESLRPAQVSVQLLRDGEEQETVELNENNGWTYRWENLPGTAVWRVIEENIPDGYTVSMVREGEKTMIVNHHEPLPTPTTTEPTPTPTVEPTPTSAPRRPTMTQLSGVKVWEDESNAYNTRPESVELILYANGMAMEKMPQWGDRSGESWTYTFSNLPILDASGNAIEYTVAEVPVAYYETTIEGTTITNRLIPQEPKEYIRVAGTKSWQDNDNADSQRPESITVKLLRNGELVEEKTVSAADGWQYAFENLPKDDGYGHDYSYTISERPVGGYYARFDGWNITNVRIPSGQDDPSNSITPRTPQFSRYTEEELEDLISIFDYDVPLWGGLLGTGDETPLYPFIFAGVGVLAVILLILFGRKKKRTEKK